MVHYWQQVSYSRLQIGSCVYLFCCLFTEYQQNENYRCCCLGSLPHHRQVSHEAEANPNSYKTVFFTCPLFDIGCVTVIFITWVIAVKSDRIFYILIFYGLLFQISFGRNYDSTIHHPETKFFLIRLNGSAFY